MGQMEDVLSAGGVLSRRLPGFRERPQQVEMARDVAACMETGGVLLVEAPTGVGKSFAYLVPALLEMVAQGRRVVISTRTIALQDQLLRKDLPLLDACLPVEVTAEKAMGRANYPSLRRLHAALADAPLLLREDADVQALRRLEAWVGTTREGAIQELEPHPGRAWEDVRSEVDNCLGRRCPEHDRCFYQSARRRLQNADVIVTNHALYFTDLALKKHDLGILPEHDALILDEAHHVEQVAAEHFGLELSRRTVFHIARRLAGGRGAAGWLQRFRDDRAATALERVGEIRDAARVFFDSLAGWLAGQPGGNGRMRERDPVPDTLSRPLERLGDALGAVADTLESDGERAELEAWALRAKGLAAETRALLAMEDPELVHFVESGSEGRDLALVARPVDVAPILARELYPRVRSVVLTSATLASGPPPAGLVHAALRLGCPQAAQVVLGSPFDHASQVEIHVPAGLPLPDQPGHGQAVARAVVHYARESGGGVFVLFTSYRALDACHAAAAPDLEAAGLTVLRQGGGLDRRVLLERFRSDGRAVLFGADSFWEGVDVPGPALRTVIITRLPFPVPDLPLNQARAERLRAEGRNPFQTLHLPEAILRFRQGFGRLMRQEDDEGTVVCLDRRILERSYGARFRRALPTCPWSEPDLPGVRPASAGAGEGPGGGG